jgi:hypothetical protein
MIIKIGRRSTAKAIEIKSFSKRIKNSRYGLRVKKLYKPFSNVAHNL